MNYLITGGAGFIGSHLAEYFLNRGDSVSIVDDLSTGTWQNVAQLDGNPNFHAFISDAADAVLMEREIRRADFVFHLASSVGVKLIVSQPVESIRRIVRPTETIVDLCAKYRKPVLLTSTSETYGKSETTPFREDMVRHCGMRARTFSCEAYMERQHALLAEITAAASSRP